MKRFALLLLASAFALTAHAGTVSISLTQNGDGAPGTAVGYGFTLTNTTNDWIVLNDSTFDGGSAQASVYGSYTDYIVNQYYVAGPAPESAVVIAPWDQNTQSGAGEFDIYASSAYFTQIAGTVSVDYSLFSQDPNDPNFDPDSLISNGTITNAVEFEATPEPSSWVLMCLPLALLMFVAGRRRKLALQSI